MRPTMIESLEALVSAQNPPTEAERARLWMEAANLELGQGDIDRICARMATMVEPSGYPAGIAWSKMVVGWSRLKRGANEEARDQFTQAYELFEQYGDTKGVARSLNGLGVVDLYLNLYDRSLETLKKARAIAESIGWDELLGSIDSNMGFVHMELGDYEEAVARLESVRASRELNFNNAVVLDSHLATAYSELGRDEEAERLLIDALEYCKKKNLGVTEIDVLGRYARLLEKRGKPDEARAFFSRGLAKARELGNQRLIAETAIEYGKLLTDLGEHHLAEGILAEAETRARECSLNALTAKALAGTARALALQDRWHEAYDRSSESARLEAVVFSENVAGQASVARAERLAAETAAYRAQMRRLALIAEIGRAIAGAVDAESVGKTLHNHISGLMPVETFALALNRESENRLEFVYFVDRGNRVPSFSLPADSEESFAAWSLRTGRDLVIADVFAEHGSYVKSPKRVGDDEREPMRSLMVCPVKLKDKVIATVSSQSARVGAYEPHHLEILRAVCAYVGVALENARLFAEVVAMAGTDPLTGCLNRRRFLEFFGRELEQVKRYGIQLGFFILDLDLFKRVNDTWGHIAGDLVIKAAAATAAKCLRSTDYLARYGGEEFVILLPNTDLEGTAIVAERMRLAFEACRVDISEGRQIGFTASFGVAACREDDDFDSLSTRADKALYEAKAAGRNRVVTSAS